MPLLLPPDEPFPPGYRVQLGEMWLEVIAVTLEGRPLRVRCHLQGMGGDDRVWVYWDSPSAAYRRTSLPAVGRSLRIAGESDAAMRLDAPELP